MKGGTTPVMPALFRGAGGVAMVKSFALSSVSSHRSRIVGEPQTSMRRRSTNPRIRPTGAFSGVPTPAALPV